MNEDILSKLPDEHLAAIAEGRLEELPDEVLQILAGAPEAPAGPAPEAPSGFRRGLMDPITGTAQLGYNILPESIQKGGDALNDWIATSAGNRWLQEKGLPHIAEIGQGGFNQQIARDEAEYQQQRAAAGETGLDWDRLGGNIVSPANLLATAQLSKLAPVANMGRVGRGYAQAATIGAGTGAMQPVTQGDFWKQKGAQTALGTVSGLGTQAAGGAISRVLRPNRTDDVMALTREGISPTPGQAAGGLIGNIEEKMMSLPVIGNAIQAGRERGMNQLTRAAYNRALGPIGKKVPKSVDIGDDAVTYIEKELGKAYDDVVPNLKAGFDDQFKTELSNLRQYAQRMSSDNLRRFERVVKEDLLDQVTPYGKFSGETFKKVESNLGHEYRTFAKSLDPKDQEYATIVKELLAELRNLQGRQNPRFAKRLADINRGWSQYDLVARASAYQGALSRGGQLTPANLSSASKAKDFTVNKRGTAKGTAPMRDLIGPAQRVLGPKVPDSGTAGRLMANTLLGVGAVSGAPGVLPALAPMAALSAPYLPFIQGAITRGLFARPDATKPIAQGIRAAAPLMVPGVNPAMQGLLGNFQ